MIGRIPCRHRFRTDEDPGTLVSRLPAGRRFRFAANADGATRFGAEPVAVVRADPIDPTGTDEGRRDPAGGAPDGSPLGMAASVLLADRLREIMPRIVPERTGPLAFPGGAVGWITWERGQRSEGLPVAHPEPGRPELWFGIYDTFAIWDPIAREVEVVSWGLRPGEGFDAREALRRAEALEERLRAGTSTPGRMSAPFPTPGRPRLSLDRRAHAAAVAEILEAISRGDVYQADLTVRFDVPTAVNGPALFERLLARNPAPCSAWIETESGSVISSSPELLLAARGRHVRTRPIKGTIGRHSDPALDHARGEALLASEKDRAELLMITDLLRNDLGKVCEYGTVRCPRLHDLESFPHVHHLVSTVEGRLRSGLDSLDALAAVFPGGSIAGAPKRSAMQLLSDLEPVPRGVYTGTVGWIGFDRSADLSVAIRSGFLANGLLSFGAGGGIVADSTPDAEWMELHLKARAFLRAIGAEEDPSVKPAPEAPEVCGT